MSNFFSCICTNDVSIVSRAELSRTEVSAKQLKLSTVSSFTCVCVCFSVFLTQRKKMND